MRPLAKILTAAAGLAMLAAPLAAAAHPYHDHGGWQGGGHDSHWHGDGWREHGWHEHGWHEHNWHGASWGWRGYAPDYYEGPGRVVYGPPMIEEPRPREVVYVRPAPRPVHVVHRRVVRHAAHHAALCPTPHH